MARVNVKSLLKSSGVAGLASFWQVASGIFLTPLVLAKVGIEGYGIWALLHGITGSMNTVTGNMSLAFAKLTAEYDTQGRQGELNGLLGSGALMISGATALGIAILWGFRTPILSTLGISDADVGVAGLALGGVLLGVFVRLSLGCYRQILAGLQRTDLLFNARILASFVYFGLALLFLQQGMGIPGLAAAFLAGELFSAGFAWFWVRRIAPGLRVRVFGATRHGMGIFLSLGGRFQLLRFIHQGADYGTRMAISALMGPAMLGTFELGRKLVNLGQTLPSAIMAPMMPAFAELHAANDEKRTVMLHHQGTRMLFVSSLVCLGFLAVFAEHALTFWTGEPHPQAAWVIRFFSLSFAINQLTGMGTASLRGRGSVALEAKTSLLALGINLALLYPLYVAWGFHGFVVAEPLGAIVGGLTFVALFCRGEGIPLGQHVREAVLRPALVVGPVIALAAWLSLGFDLSSFGLEARWNAMLELGIAGVLYVAASLGAIWGVLLSGDERSALTVRVRRLLGMPGHAPAAASR